MSKFDKLNKFVKYELEKNTEATFKSVAENTILNNKLKYSEFGYRDFSDFTEALRKHISKNQSNILNFVENTVVTGTLSKRKHRPVVYIVIGDLHAPYCHNEYLKHCVSVKNFWSEVADLKFGKNNWDLKIVNIGDEVDNQAISYHEHNPDLPSAGDELSLAKQILQDWYSEFPNMIITEGNHSLVKRKTFTAGISKLYLKDLNDVLGVPDWKFVQEHIDEDYGILFTHGTKLSKQTIEKKALQEQLSIICGHHHTLSMIEYVNQNLFTMFVGCGIDINSEAFNYSKGFAKKPVISCGVVFDGKPILEIY